MPCLRPRSLSAASSVAGLIASPLSATPSPFSKSMVMYSGCVGRILGIVGARIDVVGHFLPRILEHLALGRGVQQVGVGRERAFAALVLGHRDLVLLGPGDQRGAAGQVPFAPRGDDLDVGSERIGAQFEADLVVALAGGAVGDGVGAGLAGDLDQALGDQRAGDRGAEQVVAFVAGVGAHHREDEVADEFLAQVVDVDVLVRDAHHLGLGPRRLEFLALAEVGGEGDDFATVGHLQPLEDHAGVEAARIGEDDALDLIGHGRNSAGNGGAPNRRARRRQRRKACSRFSP